jgi:hypothetical protein
MTKYVIFILLLGFSAFGAEEDIEDGIDKNYTYNDVGEIQPESIVAQYCRAKKNLGLLAKDKKRMDELEKISGVVDLKGRYLYGKFVMAQKDTMEISKKDYKLATGKALPAAGCD